LGHGDAGEVVVQAAVATLLEREGAVLASLLGLPLVYVAYRVTVTKAISWTDAIDTAVALHRDELLKEVGARTTAGAADQHAILEGLSEFMLHHHPADAMTQRPSPA
jgi:hypothetical protein